MAVDYTLIRSERKTAALCIRDGGVVIRAPLKMPKRDIDLFVASKEKWITDKLAICAGQTKRREDFCLHCGDTVLYRGRQCTILEKDGNRAGFDGENFFVPRDLTPEQIKHACVQVYRMLAKRDLIEKTLAFAKQMSVTPCSVKVNGAKARWGSCSSNKSLNFSWRLIMAQDGVIDYVVVHELAHITEMNHSKRFWAIVEDVFPDYRERKAQLKELRQRLGGEDWE